MPPCLLCRLHILDEMIEDQVNEEVVERIRHPRNQTRNSTGHKESLKTEKKRGKDGELPDLIDTTNQLAHPCACGQVKSISVHAVESSRNRGFGSITMSMDQMCSLSIRIRISQHTITQQ